MLVPMKTVRDLSLCLLFFPKSIVIFCHIGHLTTGNIGQWYVQHAIYNAEHFGPGWVICLFQGQHWEHSTQNAVASEGFFEGKKLQTIFNFYFACSPEEFCEYFFRVCLGILH